MNKYADKAKEIRKERFKKRSCLDKIVYLTRIFINVKTVVIGIAVDL